MKKYKKVTKTIQNVELKECFCNCCGEEMVWGEAGFDQSKKLYGVNVHVEGHYGSRRLEDLSLHWFDLCEDCLVDFMDSFKIPATTGECSLCMGGGDTKELEFSKIEEEEDEYNKATK